jgi:hypothetical protein
MTGDTLPIYIFTVAVEGYMLSTTNRINTSTGQHNDYYHIEQNKDTPDLSGASTNKFKHTCTNIYVS